MKHTHLVVLGFILVFGFFSCKKDRGPRLIVHVQEKDGTAAPGATVNAWYSNDFKTGVVNEMYNQTTFADGAGDAVFDFKNSAVLDVDVVYYKTYLDTLLNSVTDTLYGHRVVKIEMVRQKSKENNYNETVVVE
jgi:hypothetical protein